MPRIEILSPAGSLEGVYAAVQNGADAVYMGYGEFNARRNARNLTAEDMRRAVEYCRERDVKTYITLNILLSDRELARGAELLREISVGGADAVIIQDVGLARIAKQVAPELPLHASTQMSVHSLEGVLAAAELGFSRVVVARELSATALRTICERSPIGIEIFAHGALCMCHSGQCYMSALIGRRSGNRGLCAQPCRMGYTLSGQAHEGYPLSLRDLCMAPHLRELSRMGIASVKIEGRMKRPEYTGLITGIYSRALRSGEGPTPKELEDMRLMFSRSGFTDGYYTEKRGAPMFGVRAEAQEPTLQALYKDVRATYERGDLNPRVPLSFLLTARPGSPLTLHCEDNAGHVHTARGPVPQAAERRALVPDDVHRALARTGGTPYYADKVQADIEPGLSAPLSSLNALRRECLEHMAEQRCTPPVRKELPYRAGTKRPNVKSAPALTISVMHPDQITPALLETKPALLYLPLIEAVQDIDRLDAILRTGVPVAVTLPRVVSPQESGIVLHMLEQAYTAGVREALAGNLGHIVLAHRAGLRVRGDYGLNVYNAETLKALRRFGCQSATLSFELRFAQIRDLSKGMDTEIIVYGRLPLMVTENCISSTSNPKAGGGQCSCEMPRQLTDRQGRAFPVVAEFGCRSQLLNAEKLYLADKQSDYRSLGLWAARLFFTTENPGECARIAAAYAGEGGVAPGNFTRGLYYRGVE